MKSVRIYTTPTCPYCIKAKELLRSIDVEFEEIDVAGNPEERERIITEFEWQTVPAIFIGDKLIGGYDDLVKLQGDGNLMAKLRD